MDYKPTSLSLFILLLCCVMHNSNGFLDVGLDGDNSGQCEPIRVTTCSHLKYNMTSLPNVLGQSTQEEVMAELVPYWQLVNLFNCSQHINFFLCSLFVPMCTMQLDGPLVINVCPSMCYQVKKDCEETLARINIPWPLDCSQLPESNGKQQLCMAPQGDGWASPGPSSRTSPQPVIRPTNPAIPFTVAENVVTPEKGHMTSCPDKYVRYENTSCTNLCDPNCKDCVPKCEDVFYTKEHKNFTYTWMAIWSSLCIASTLFTIITFCIEPSRFRYPTRPVIFMALCYLMYALSYFVPLFIPRERIICKPEIDESLMLVNGMESTLCIIIFLIQYYFGIASHIWWLILTLTWYLAASRKWGLEAINSIACYFHLFAWAVPAVLTVVILVTGKVDSNELTGMCYIGNHDKWPLLVYIIIPLCLLCFIGQIFLLAGFTSLLRIRTNLKTQVDDANVRKLEKLMAKIGIFAILYTVPTVCVLGSNIHEFMNMDTWRCMSSLPSITNSIPTVEIHMLKIFMSLIIGICISMWVLSSKTLRSCERKCGGKSTDMRVLHQRQYRKQPSYVIAKLTDCDGLVKHYKFPASHSTISTNQKHFNSRTESAGPVNL